MLRNKRGIAMLLTLSLILFLLVLGGAVLMISSGHAGTSIHQLRRIRAYYAGEAALQEALWKCRDGQYDLSAGQSDNITITDPNYSFVVQITVEAPQAGSGINQISAKVVY